VPSTLPSLTFLKEQHLVMLLLTQLTKAFKKKTVWVPLRRHETPYCSYMTFSGTRLSKLECHHAQTPGAHSLTISTRVVSVELFGYPQNF
jgi:hypothetical protein